jgi:hypothetical protein
MPFCLQRRIATRPLAGSGQTGPERWETPPGASACLLMEPSQGSQGSGYIGMF